MKVFIDEVEKTDIDVHKTIRKVLIAELAEKAGIDLDQYSDGLG